MLLYYLQLFTTCTSDRSFSSLKRVKKILKINYGENRFNGLALLNIHPEIIIKPEEVAS